MQDTVKRSLVATSILGFLFPSISLLYVRREGLAVFIMAFLVASVLALVYTDLTFFATSFWIFVLFQIFLWLMSFALGIWYAWRGVELEKLRQDKGLSWVMYVLLLLTFVSLLTNLPVSFFQVKNNFAQLYADDLLVVQKVKSEAYFQAMDTLIFLDNNYQENIAQVLATPRDVLSLENGKIYRNDIVTNIEMTLPTASSSQFNNSEVLLSPQSKNALSSVDQNTMNLAINSWLVPDDTLLIRYPNTDVALLPFERVRGKAIYVLFSKEISQNGKSLTSVVIP